VEIAGGEIIVDQTAKSKFAQKKLQYDYLNDTGLSRLELLMALLFKNHAITYSPMIIHIVGLLLIYLKPSEVYFVLSELISRAKEAYFNKRDQALIRWHLTLEKT
jgi:hypothetical protein